MSTGRRRCSPSRRTRCMRFCSGGTCRDVRWAGRGSPRQRRCCIGGAIRPAAPDRRAGDGPGARDGPRGYCRAGGYRTDRASAARHHGPARRAVRPYPGRCQGWRSSAYALARCHYHSASDCFVSCCVRAGPVFVAMFFPDEPNARDDRALSLTEMSTLHRMTWRSVESIGLKHLRGHEVREGSRCRHMGIPAVEARQRSTTCAVACTAPTNVGIFPGKLLS
jgi:hypothetical protein